jgi:hypothetical protein
MTQPRRLHTIKRNPRHEAQSTTQNPRLISLIKVASYIHYRLIALLRRNWFHCLDWWSCDYGQLQIRVSDITRPFTDFPVLLTNCTQMAEKMSNKVPAWCFLQKKTWKRMVSQSMIIVTNCIYSDIAKVAIKSNLTCNRYAIFMPIHCG